MGLGKSSALDNISEEVMSIAERSILAKMEWEDIVFQKFRLHHVIKGWGDVVYWDGGITQSHDTVKFGSHKNQAWQIGSLSKGLVLNGDVANLKRKKIHSILSSVSAINGWIWGMDKCNENHLIFMCIIWSVNPAIWFIKVSCNVYSIKMGKVSIKPS